MGKYFILIFTGDGKGKTSAAVGAAIRAAGQGREVCFVQFLKGESQRKSDFQTSHGQTPPPGEIKLLEKIPQIKVHRFGRKGFFNLKKPDRGDRKLANEALDCALSSLRNSPFLIVLDEINLACAFGLIDKNKVLEFLEKAKKTSHVILTGRSAPPEFIKLADLATEFRGKKHYYKKIKRAIRGLEY